MTGSAAGAVMSFSMDTYQVLKLPAATVALPSEITLLFCTKLFVMSAADVADAAAIAVPLPALFKFITLPCMLIPAQVLEFICMPIWPLEGLQAVVMVLLLIDTAFAVVIALNSIPIHAPVVSDSRMMVLLLILMP